jgi:hypothetical protein
MFKTLHHLNQFKKIKTIGYLNVFNFSKIIQVKLPDLGEAMKEAKILKWYKREGEEINDV